MARPRGNYAVTAARRLAILDAGLQVFGRNGYNGSSLKQIAELVGITEAGILHHFKTKSELLIAVLDHRDEVTQSWFTTEGGDSLNYVVDWLRLLQHNMSNPGIVELYATLSGEATSPGHPANDYFRQRYETVREYNQANFQRLITDGHITDGAPSARDLAVWLAALSDGLQIQWMLNREVDLLAETESFFRTILKHESMLLALERYEAIGPFVAVEETALSVA